MPMIPNYTGALRESADVPQGFMLDSATPAAFGADIAEAQSKFGRSVQSAGDTLGDIALRQQDIYNQGALNDLDNNRITKTAPLTAEFNQKTGADALRALPGYLSSVKAINDEILASAPNSAVARQAALKFNNAYSSTFTGAQDHSSAQTKVYATNTALNASKIATDNAGARAEEDFRGFSSDKYNAMERAKEAALLQYGGDPNNPNVEIAMKNAATTAWSNRLKGLASSGKSEQARAEFDTNRKEINDPNGTLDEFITTQQKSEGAKRFAQDITSGDLAGIAGRENYAVTKLSAIVGKIGAAGLVGGFHVEAPGLNPGAVNPGDGSDGSDSIGILQANSDRAIALKKFANEQGRPWNDYKLQVDFVIKELKDHPEIVEALKNAKTPEEAARIANSRYEVSADKPGMATYDARLRHASRIAKTNYGPLPGSLTEASPEADVVAVQNAAEAQARSKWGDDPDAIAQYRNQVRARVSSDNWDRAQKLKANLDGIADIAYPDPDHPRTLEQITSDPKYVTLADNIRQTPGGVAKMTKIEAAITKLAENPPDTAERDEKWRVLEGIRATDPKRYIQIPPEDWDLTRRQAHEMTKEQAKMTAISQGDPSITAAMKYYRETGVLGTAGIKENTAAKHYPDTDKFVGQLTVLSKQWMTNHPGEVPGQKEYEDFGAFLLRNRAPETMWQKTVPWGQGPREYRGDVPPAEAERFKQSFINKFGQDEFDQRIKNNPNFIREAYSAALYQSKQPKRLIRE